MGIIMAILVSMWALLLQNSLLKPQEGTRFILTFKWKKAHFDCNRLMCDFF